ncbi:class I SAM-dependent methyltransferase [Curtobacterium sp. PhB25]|uniref:class I SAM-dependent methyltransferase n=1 Tax=Curtobacterium sp. PhB25 TaxID=2485205 RepID=UPI001066DC61|nr:class I SAM-dependent methyltransferase [Curtobacterium sp. PhB25]
MSDHDGSAGDADYGAIGAGYTQYRRPEPAFSAAIRAALGDARTLVNVGAGAGSYEPSNLEVTAVEPSATMRAQRPMGSAPALDATAEDLPFGHDTFDAALASFTVHQWRDLPAGLREVRRVTRGPVVILTCDPAALTRSWINEYAPEVIATEASRYPSIDALRSGLSVAKALFDVAAEWAGRHGISTIGLDTAAPAAHLVTMYTRWGFAHVDNVRFPGKSYSSVVMTRQDPAQRGADSSR